MRLSIQAYLFSRASSSPFATIEKAEGWLEYHKKVPIKPVHSTQRYHRFRMINPSKFVSGSLRTIEVCKGVKAIKGRLRKRRK